MHQPFAAGKELGPWAGKVPRQLVDGPRVEQRNGERTVDADLLSKDGEVRAAGAQSHDAELIGKLSHELEGPSPDGPRGPENRDGLHPWLAPDRGNSTVT